MIRTAREKGSTRGPAGALAGFLLIAAAAGAAARSARGAGPAWWEIRLTVAAKGAYVIRGGEAPLSGEYVFRARYEGRLNPDGDDFLLVHVKSETLEWALREKAARDGPAGLIEAPAAPPPALHLNYVLRDRDEIAVDFAIEGGTVPLRAQPPAFLLELPCSGRGPEGRPGYVDDVIGGSNRIVLPASDLSRRRPERSFAWTWSGTKLVTDGPRTYAAVQSHSAEAVVALVRH